MYNIYNIYLLLCGIAFLIGFIFGVFITKKYL